MSVPKKADSIFDVLYADTRRLSSLLSQFSDDGVVTEITKAATDSSSTELGLSLKVIKSDSTETGTTSASRRIDPQWLLPLLFLDKANDIINRDISAATIGSLALATGKLIVTDLSVLQELWKSPALKRQLIKAAADRNSQQEDEASQVKTRQVRRADQRNKQDQDFSEQEAVFEMLPLMPHLAQANIVTDDFAVWSTLDPKYLVGSMADLALKHGAKVAGRWSVVGILDAKPFQERDDDDYDDILSALEQVRIGMFADNIWKVATQLATPIRQALGRPIMSYGITPLVIFREIQQ